MIAGGNSLISGTRFEAVAVDAMPAPPETDWVRVELAADAGMMADVGPAGRKMAGAVLFVDESGLLDDALPKSPERLLVPGLDAGSTIRIVLPGDENATGVALFDRAVAFESELLVPTVPPVDEPVATVVPRAARIRSTSNAAGGLLWAVAAEPAWAKVGEPLPGENCA